MTITKKGVSLIPNKKIANLSVALYSVSQKCFHIELLHEYVAHNVTHALNDLNKEDYRLIGIFENDVEAGEYIDTFRQFLIKEKIH